MSSKHHSIIVLPPDRRLAEIMVVVDIHRYDMINFESVLGEAIDEGIKSFDALSDINTIITRFQNFPDGVGKLARLGMSLGKYVRTLPGKYRFLYDVNSEFLDVIHKVQLKEDEET